MAKKVNARIAQKYDSLQNWQKATGFIPEQGELFLVDDYDFPIIIGDGATPASTLCEKKLIDTIEISSIDSLFVE